MLGLPRMKKIWMIWTKWLVAASLCVVLLSSVSFSLTGYFAELSWRYSSRRLGEPILPSVFGLVCRHRSTSHSAPSVDASVFRHVVALGYSGLISGIICALLLAAVVSSCTTDNTGPPAPLRSTRVALGTLPLAPWPVKTSSVDLSLAYGSWFASASSFRLLNFRQRPLIWLLKNRLSLPCLLSHAISLPLSLWTSWTSSGYPYHIRLDLMRYLWTPFAKLRTVFCLPV